MQPTDDKTALYSKLIDGCINNRRDAQYELYNLLSGKMFAVCLRYAKNREAAEDLLQEGFVKVFNNIEKFRSEGSFEGWVRRIIVNTAVEHYRKSTKMYSIVNVDDINMDIPWIDTGDDLQLEDLTNMINKLSPADMLQINEGTSKSQLARARYILMEMVKKSEHVKIENKIEAIAK